MTDDDEKTKLQLPYARRVQRPQGWWWWIIPLVIIVSAVTLLGIITLVMLRG